MSGTSPRYFWRIVIVWCSPAVVIVIVVGIVAAVWFSTGWLFGPVVQIIVSGIVGGLVVVYGLMLVVSLFNAAWDADEILRATAFEKKWKAETDKRHARLRSQLDSVDMEAASRWQMIRNTNEESTLEDFIKKYAKSHYAGTAINRLERLKRELRDLK